MPIGPDNPFKGRQHPGDLIILCVRWYLQYPLSYQHVAELVAERGVVEDDHVIQALSPDRADDAFNIRTFPGRPGSRKDLLDPHGFHFAAVLTVKDAVAITKKVSRGLVEGKSFPQLLGSPFGGGMGGDVEAEMGAGREPAPEIRTAPGS